MSFQQEFDELFNSIHINKENSHKINELKSCFDENHIEAFLEKLIEIDDIDEFLETSNQNPDITNQFLDFVSELIINK